MADAQVDDGSITTLAGLFGGWSTEVASMITSLETIAVEAGTFQAAANTYETTTNDNDVAASVLDQLSKDVSDNLPGFKNFSK
jgi:hypothetical protein